MSLHEKLYTLIRKVCEDTKGEIRSRISMKDIQLSKEKKQKNKQ